MFRELLECVREESVKALEEQEGEAEGKKPRVKLVGQDGNVFNLIGLASRALKKAGMPEKAKELQKKAFSAHGYDEVLALIQDYCEVY